MDNCPHNVDKIHDRQADEETIDRLKNRHEYVWMNRDVRSKRAQPRMVIEVEQIRKQPNRDAGHEAKHVYDDRWLLHAFGVVSLSWY